MTAYPKATPLFTKRRLTWASAAAVAGCAACCALPLLALAGVGGGAVAAIAAFFKPGMELVMGAGLFAFTLGVMALVDRRRKRSQQAASGAASDAGGACGCGPSSSVYRSPARDPDASVACTADLSKTEAIQAHMDAYRDAFASLTRTDRFAGGFRWHFDARPGLERRLKEIAEREHQCCTFFDFIITTEGNEVVWEVRADENASAVLDEFSRIPERLVAEPRKGHDLSHLKQTFDNVGLTFTHDLTRAAAPASPQQGSPSSPRAR